MFVLCVFVCLPFPSIIIKQIGILCFCMEKNIKDFIRLGVDNGRDIRPPNKVKGPPDDEILLAE